MTFTLTTHCHFQAEAEWSSDYNNPLWEDKKPAIPTTKMVCIMSLHIPLGVVVLLPEFTHPFGGSVAP